MKADVGLYGQQRIKEYVKKNGKNNLVVIIGAPDDESSRFFAKILIEGSPKEKSPLANLALGLPVYHILEPVIVEQFESKLYKEKLKSLEGNLDVSSTSRSLEKLRQSIN